MSHPCLSLSSKVLSLRLLHWFCMDSCRDILCINRHLYFFPDSCLNTGKSYYFSIFLNLPKYLADCSLTAQWKFSLLFFFFFNVYRVLYVCMCYKPPKPFSESKQLGYFQYFPTINNTEYRTTSFSLPFT